MIESIQFWRLKALSVFEAHVILANRGELGWDSPWPICFV